MRLFKGYQVNRILLLAAAAPRFTKTEAFPFGVDKHDVDIMIEKASTDRPELCRSFVDEKLFARAHSSAVKGWFTAIAQSASGIGTIKAAASLRDEDGSDDLNFVNSMNVPVFIIRGEKDTVVPVSVTDYQHKHIRNSTLFSLKNSAHAVIYDELENFNNYFIKSLTDYS
jgi:non-heme chloroperoxidase